MNKMTPCEQLGVCRAMNCKDCDLAKKQNKTNQDEMLNTSVYMWRSIKTNYMKTIPLKQKP
jgi:hypothetical protein